MSVSAAAEVEVGLGPACSFRPSLSGVRGPEAEAGLRAICSLRPLAGAVHGSEAGPRDHSFAPLQAGLHDGCVGRQASQLSPGSLKVRAQPSSVEVEGISVYTCPQCRKSFSTKAEMKQHWMQEHSGASGPAAPRAPVVPARLSPTAAGAFGPSISVAPAGGFAYSRESTDVPEAKPESQSVSTASSWVPPPVVRPEVPVAPENASYYRCPGCDHAFASRREAKEHWIMAHSAESPTEAHVDVPLTAALLAAHTLRAASDGSDPFEDEPREDPGQVHLGTPEEPLSPSSATTVPPWEHQDW